MRTAAAIIMAFALSSTSVAIGADPAAQCQARKLKAAGAAANGIVRCHAQAASAGSMMAASVCVQSETASLVAPFATAESRGGCLTSGDAAAVGALLQSGVASLVASLRPVATASACAAAKINAEGRYVASLLTTTSKLRVRSFNAARVNNRATDRLLNSFAGAEAGSGCLTTQDAGSVRARGRGFVGDVVEPLWPVSSRGLVLSHPPEWHLSPGALVSPTSFSLDTFFSEYLPNAVRPAGGAAIFVANVPLPNAALDEIIQSERLPVEVVDSTSAVTVDGEAGTRITYHYEVAPGATSRGVLVYIPHAGRLFKFFLDYYANDPNEAAYVSAFGSILNSVQFEP